MSFLHRNRASIFMLLAALIQGIVSIVEDDLEEKK